MCEGKTSSKSVPDITIVQHPVSGEIFAVELDASGEIIEAAGPLHHADARDEDSLSGWLANNLDAREDGVWLRNELSAGETEN